jgi:ATP synthase mitochondrial F1 complex assembly factor 2
LNITALLHPPTPCGHPSGLDPWRLTAADALASACKSVLLSIALVEGRITAGAAVHATRIEEDMQIEEWGLVEGGHDIDVADAHARIGAAVVFLKLLKAPLTE